MRRRLIILLALATPLAVDAQVFEVRRTSEPMLWTSLSAGFHEAQSVVDGRTQSVWGFGGGLQYRATVEVPMQRGASAGALVTYSRMPLTYHNQSGIPIGTACAQRCDAHADLWSLMGLFRIGGGDGFHQVIDLAVGVVRYANFEVDATGDRLPPEQDTDMALTIGYGFGYAFSQRFHVMLVQDFSVAMHQSEGLSGDASRMQQQRTTRIGVRYGAGSRSR